MVKLDNLVMKMVFESYGVAEKQADSYIESVNYVLRYFEYRSSEMNETIMGLTPHTDKTMTSIIHQTNHVSGLQVMKPKDGDDEWIDIYPSPSSFIVMGGDALMVSHSLVPPSLFFSFSSLSSFHFI